MKRTSRCRILSRSDLAPDKRIQIQCCLDVVNALQHRGHFSHHFLSDLLVVGFGELAALVFEVEILDVAEDNFLLSKKKIPFGLFDDRGFDGVFLAEQRNADRSKYAASQQAAEQVDHQSSGVSLRSSSSISFS